MPWVTASSPSARGSCPIPTATSTTSAGRPEKSAPALGEDGEDLGGRDPPLRQQHQQVIDEVGGLFGHAPVVGRSGGVVLGGQKDLRRLFRHLSPGCVGASGDQPGGVASLGPRPGPFFDRLPQDVQRSEAGRVPVSPTGHGAEVAGGPVGDGPHQNGVPVAVELHRHQLQPVARRGALFPQLLAGPRPERHPPALFRGFVCRRVHPPQHQHQGGLGVLDDGGHEAVFAPVGLPHCATSRTGIPAPAIAAFTSAIVISRRWKMEAASTAEAPPTATASTQCWALPAPPEAMTGMSTASDTARVSSRSKPSLVPSRSIEVRRISPAPRAAPRFAHSTASSPVGVRPPFTTTSNRPWLRRASIANTTHWRPNRSAQAAISPGSFTAAVFTDTLSAPARSTAFMSSGLRTPPPTVRGTNTLEAVRRTTSRVVPRSSGVAEMSRKQISSAPSSA